MNKVQGDLIELAIQGDFNIIVHGCNCFNTMGSGIAKQIRNVFPEAYEVDQLTVKGDRKKLGTYTYFKHFDKDLDRDFFIINAYTQYNYLPRNVVNVDYEAITSAFKEINKQFGGKGNHLAYPKIGAGLAGGDWDIISKIINDQLNELKHTLVEYQ